MQCGVGFIHRHNQTGIGGEFFAAEAAAAEIFGKEGDLIDHHTVNIALFDQFQRPFEEYLTALGIVQAEHPVDRTIVEVAHKLGGVFAHHAEAHVGVPQKGHINVVNDLHAALVRQPGEVSNILIDPFDVVGVGVARKHSVDHDRIDIFALQKYRCP